jgi:transcription initiation factor TFIIIB Brf1 subunit/transcription initiation factor TFIIB
MSETYCPSCQRITTTVEEVLASSYLYVCTECGAVIEDSPIQEPGSSGEDLEQRESNSQHWTLSLGGAVRSNWAQRKALLNEDSAVGRAYRRSESDKHSPLFSAISASISALCSKLNLDQSLRTRIHETWYSIRGRRGLAQLHVEREVAPILGVACLYWVCRVEGLDIAPTRLASLAGTEKGVFLRASMKVEKVLGFPVPVNGTERITLTAQRTVADVLDKVRARNSQHAEDAESLAGIFQRLGMAVDERMEDLAKVCAFYFLGKFEKRRADWNLEHFCTKYSLSFNSSLLDFERKLYRIFVGIALEYTETKNADDCVQQVICKFRDFANFMDNFSGDDMPEDLRILLTKL